MDGKLYKAKLITSTDEEIDLAWNIHHIEFDNGYLTLDHSKGRVIHFMERGETISFIEQVNQGAGDERRGA